MMSNHPLDIADWLCLNFEVSTIIGGEVKMPCPKCEHPNFYFNIYKRIGHCFRAACEFNPRLSDIVEIVGAPPTKSKRSGIGRRFDPIFNQQTVPTTSVEVNLKWATRIIVNKVQYRHSYPDGTVRRQEDRVESWEYTNYKRALALHSRGLTDLDILTFDIRWTEESIVVPVSEARKYVQFVERYINLHAPPDEQFKLPRGKRRYNYGKANPISHFLFNWDEAQHWDDLVLVENTFNAIWLQNHIHCTTSFGSGLSDVQIDKITKSKVKKVTILWDAGAEVSAQKAARKLRSKGIEAVPACLPSGQPDDYALNDLLEHIK